MQCFGVRELVSSIPVTFKNSVWGKFNQPNREAAGDDWYHGSRIKDTMHSNGVTYEVETRSLSPLEDLRSY